MNSVLVLGAGMVGVATALALQARGHQVVLADQRKPGLETSYGNAGIIQIEAAEPYAMPRGITDLLKIALRRGNDVLWHPSAIPSHLTPLWLYFRNSGAARHREISRTYVHLTSRAGADHAPLIAAADAETLIRRDGFRQVYRSQRGLGQAETETEHLRREYGVASTLLDGPALAKAEPGLLTTLAGAIHWTDSWTCADPGGLVRAYAKLFRARGGELMLADATTLQRDGSGWSIANAGGKRTESAREAVIALGPWSAGLCKRFGLTVPMLGKRGYHQHFETTTGPDLPMLDVSGGAVLSSMHAGLRITTGAEIARRGSPPDYRQLRRATAAARQLFSFGEPLEATPWMGTRPCMPDMLPVVGQVPGAPGLWAHFGHGHQGFTLGPTTAALLADEMTGETPAFPALSPANRFPVKLTG